MAKVDRFAWVDVARGMGILLVVVGHVLRGLVSSRLVSDPDLAAWIDRFIYAFHMPLFFWLSGLFAQKKLARSFQSFITTLAKTVLYPYLIWSALQTVVQIALSRHTNNPASVSSLLRIPFDPPMQFWFLYVLALVSSLHFLLARWWSPRTALWLAIGLELARHALPQGTWGVLLTTLWYLPFYALGALMLEPTDRLLSRRSPAWQSAAALGCFMAMGVLLATYGGATLPRLGADLFRAILACLGSLGVVLAAGALALTRLGRVLDVWGRASLQIYVAHTLASAGTRILLVRLGVRDTWVHFTVGTVTGILFPLLLHWFVMKRRVPFVFSWGYPKQ